MVHIYFGNGKGKTTAAAGLCIRAMGYGVPVTIVQFLKDGNSGEMRYLEGTGKARILHAPDHFGFWKNMSDSRKEETKRQCRELLKNALMKVKGTDNNSGKAQISGIVVLDEILTAAGYGIFESSEIAGFINELPKDTEVILTGKEAQKELLDLADYITEMRMVRHPYSKGIKARCGVEK